MSDWERGKDASVTGDQLKMSRIGYRTSLLVKLQGLLVGKSILQLGSNIWQIARVFRVDYDGVSSPWYHKGI